ncbi:hypothetical protein BC936DRAFT_148587 [Jimgerdemannia flammicorona]|uniref:Uncharacterized protein n=1 Tax=Jimgerdemannia flammicorona TaxID=994334 RepID=A0A433D2P9_9FUNG|nr:hypothetical protein BC936DRAFT_148587 [Jimgerdemannia flammicorona]
MPSVKTGIKTPTRRPSFQSPPKVPSQPSLTMRPAIIASIYLLLLLALLAPEAHATATKTVKNDPTVALTACKPPTWTGNPSAILTAVFVQNNVEETSWVAFVHPPSTRYRQQGGSLHNSVTETGVSEIQVYGGICIWSSIVILTLLQSQPHKYKYNDYRAKYDELWPQGWHLTTLENYVYNNEVLYSAVWRKSTVEEIQLYTANYRSDILLPVGIFGQEGLNGVR